MSFGRDIAWGAAADIGRVILFSLVLGGMFALLLRAVGLWLIHHVRIV